jgi:hypothetical protein
VPAGRLRPPALSHGPAYHLVSTAHGGDTLYFMSSVPANKRRWLFLVKPRWLAWHAFAVVAFIGMLWLGDWQFHRAIGGNTLSWAYTFEWPIFAVLGAIFWAKTIIDEWRGPDYVSRKKRQAAAAARPVAGAAGAAVTLPGGLPGGLDPDVAGEEDPELAAYNAYLARLHTEVRRHGRWHGLR